VPQTLSAIFVHVIFSTKGREPLISDDIAPRLHAYMGGIARQEEAVALAIGGINDHVHLLLSLSPKHSSSNLIRDIKACSSRWVHGLSPAHSGFAWQAGYAVFSVSVSNVEAVKQYLASQREHHQRLTFKEELVAFLERHNVEYDERYVFD
jgi:REP element-mobilizing transposase RayT